MAAMGEPTFKKGLALVTVLMDNVCTPEMLYQVRFSDVLYQ